MEYKQTVIIEKVKADRIELFLAVDDISTYDGILDVAKDSCNLIASVEFNDGAKISVALMSDDVNYHISAFFDAADGSQDEGEPDRSLCDVEYEHGGNTYVLHFEIDD